MAEEEQFIKDEMHVKDYQQLGNYLIKRKLENWKYKLKELFSRKNK